MFNSLKNYKSVVLLNQSSLQKDLKNGQKEQFEKFSKHQEELNLKVIENLETKIQVRYSLEFEKVFIKNQIVFFKGFENWPQRTVSEH